MEIQEIARTKRLPPPAIRRALRVAAGLTLQDVADVVGVTRQAVAKWETGERNPAGGARTAYAQALSDLRRAVTEEGVE